MDKIAVLIPCFNEAQTIEKVVTDFHRVLPEAVIYVYDNNSTDGTADRGHCGAHRTENVNFPAGMGILLCLLFKRGIKCLFFRCPTLLPVV